MNPRTISPEKTLLSALKMMDELDKKLLLVMDGTKFKGLLSAGDIQRAIIANVSLNIPTAEVLRENIRVGRPGDDFSDIKKMMLEFRMELCPVINEAGELEKVYYWEELFTEQPLPAESQFNVPVIIMAGGFGTRLRPLTNVLPKPLIPIGEKTMLEEIFQRFNKHGCDNYYISVNYKAELIEFYLKSLQLSFSTTCFLEEKPLGTAGSLSLLKGKLKETFFVSNCDIIIEQDYSEILNYHREQENEITLVAALKHFPIAYGTLQTAENGRLVGLDEKPELTFKINSGMYILEPHLLEEIPENTFFHITHLIHKIMERGGKVGVFPVSEKSWKDIGEAHLLKEYFNV